MTERIEKKERILNAARGLFARFGLRKCSIDEIAKAARVGKGTIYLYFSSKEEVFAAVVEREAEILFSHIKRQVSAVDDPAEKLRSYVLSRFEHLRELSNLLEISKEVVSELEPLVEQARGRFNEMESSMVAEILALGKQNGTFEVGDCKLVAAVIILGIKGLEFPTILRQFPVFHDRGGIEAMVDVLLNGLRTR